LSLPPIILLSFSRPLMRRAEEILSVLGSDEPATLLSKACTILPCALQWCRICVAETAMAYVLTSRCSRHQ
jgi:hypothetical protein